jgi:ATP-dependent helicase HrpA
VNKIIKKNTGNTPVLKFLKDILIEMQRLVPVNFPELYTFDRMNDLPRYCRALYLLAERGSLNLTSAQKKMQEVEIYSEQLKQMLNGKNSSLPSLEGRGRGRVGNDRSNLVSNRQHKDCHVHCRELARTNENCDTVWQAGIEKISCLKNDISVNYPEEKKTLIEELFWMIEEYKVSLFAQELKTPYPVSPKKLNQLIEEIEKL